MLHKSKDDIQPLLQQLAALNPRTKAEREAVEREKAMLLSGNKAERDAAYQMDFQLKDHKSWHILHDLRFEHAGFVAQIDHLAFNLLWDFYIIETKNIQTKVKVENNRWSALYGNHWQGIPSPVEQNARHISLLKRMIEDKGLMPKVLGMRVSPRFVNVVVVPSGCVIQSSAPDRWVLHMDEFVRKLRSDFSGLKSFSLARTLSNPSEGEMAGLAYGLLRLHKPFKIDYAAKFGLDKPIEGQTCCEACSGAMTDAEVFFCRINKARFAGQKLCQKCQKLAPEVLCDCCHTAVISAVVDFCKKEARRLGGKVLCQACQRDHPTYIDPVRLEPKAEVEHSAPLVAARCASCGEPVDKKVVAFCRFNSKKLGGKVLCRKCQ